MPERGLQACSSLSGIATAVECFDHPIAIIVEVASKASAVLHPFKREYGENVDSFSLSFAAAAFVGSQVIAGVDLLQYRLVHL